MKLEKIDKTNLRECSLYLILRLLENDEIKISKQLNFFRENIYLADERNYSFINELVLGVFRRLVTIDSYLKILIKKDFNKLPAIILNILRIALYQLLFMNDSPEFAVVDESVKLAKKYGHIGTVKLTNGVLRNFLRKKDELKSEFEKLSINEQLSANSSLPLWLIEYWSESLSVDELNILGQELLKLPEFYLRINTLKISVAKFKKLLKEEHISFEDTIIEEGIRITSKVNPRDLIGYDEGFWYIQDLGSMLVSKVLNPEKDSFVIDFCAFPGGKTTHISQLMENTGTVLALDINRERQKIFDENIHRLGNKNIDILIQEASRSLDLETLADKVLVDPPCSGLGVIKRKPEIKLRRNIHDVKRLANVQLNILTNASKYVKIGGELVYSTCTISAIENEMLISRFLKENKNFEYSKIDILNENNENEGFINVLPHKYLSDGFFIAKLRRID